MSNIQLYPFENTEAVIWHQSFNKIRPLSWVKKLQSIITPYVVM